VRRREFISLLGGAAATWPLAARAQQARIAFLGAESACTNQHFFDAFRQGMREQGYWRFSSKWLELLKEAVA